MDEYSNSGIRKYDNEDGKLQPSMKKSKKVDENYLFFMLFLFSLQKIMFQKKINIFLLYKILII
jgi:hypothetical protein